MINLPSHTKETQFYQLYVAPITIPSPGIKKMDKANADTFTIPQDKSRCNLQPLMYPLLFLAMFTHFSRFSLRNY